MIEIIIVLFKQKIWIKLNAYDYEVSRFFLSNLYTILIYFLLKTTDTGTTVFNKMLYIRKKDSGVD